MFFRASQSSEAALRLKMARRYKTLSLTEESSVQDWLWAASDNASVCVQRVILVSS